MSIITLTDAAVGHIKQMLAQNANGKGFRLSVKKTGCSGYAYVPKIVESLTESDVHFARDDLQVYVDPACVDFVAGLIIDYVDDNIGLKQKRLVFINPHEKNRCGCGESFTIE